MAEWNVIHIFLWILAAGHILTATIIDREWDEGWWLRLKPWAIRLAVAGAVWCIYAAGSLIPWVLP